MSCNKLLKTGIKYAGAIFAAVLVWANTAHSQEITAINFNGELLGKVIPDGKVVSFDNKLIGNVTADSLIVDSEGKLIGGVVPQGVAIGNDAKPLGKAGSDGSVRLPSGQTVGRVLPNGLVVNEYYDVIGGVVFPGLVYADDGKTIGRVTGDGQFTNLQGQNMGVIMPDGFAYRKIGPDYILAGKLMSSKMVVSLQGEFIGSVMLGGQVSDFDSEIIGRIKANGYVYNDQNQIIGHIVNTGYAFDNNGYYLGFITYNGEVVRGNKSVGHIRADGYVADSENKIIGYRLDFAATATDSKGKYLGRIMPDGNLARAKSVTSFLGPRGLVSGADGNPIGQISATGPVFDYKGALRGHALSNGTVISLNGTTIGYMIGSDAFDLSGRMIGAVLRGQAVFTSDNVYLGMSGIGSGLTGIGDGLIVSPRGYVFNQEGVLRGSGSRLAPMYSPTGSIEALLGLNGRAVSSGGSDLGAIKNGGFVINTQNRLIAKAIKAWLAISYQGGVLGNLNAENLVMDSSLNIVAKVLPDNSVVEADRADTVNYNPVLGQAYSGKIALDLGGDILGYADILGQVNNFSGAKIGAVAENSQVIDNNGLIVGAVHDYAAMLNDSCEIGGVLTPRGDVQNYRGTYVGKVLGNRFVISDSGSYLGYLAQVAPVIDFSGRIIGFSAIDGRVMSFDNADLGCLDKFGLLHNADKAVIGSAAVYATAMDFSGNIIGRSVLDGGIVNDSNQMIAYQQPDGNVNSNSGLPLGNMFKYKVAFNMDNRYIGRVRPNGEVVDDKGGKVGQVNFEGYVLVNNQKAGYALYDFYIYDADNRVIGIIGRNGDVTNFTNQSLGRVERGFLVDKNETVIGRGSRDYLIRDNSHLVLGELRLDGTVADNLNLTVGTIGKAGEIINGNNETIATAYPLQYYSKITAQAKRQMVFDKDGNFIGYLDENGNLVDKNGNVVGTVDKDGKITYKDGSSANRDIGQIVYDKDGNNIGKVMADGSVVDADGKTIGQVDENGNVKDANGNVIGGIGRNWYEKVARPDVPVSSEDISPALKLLESKQYRKSLGIALTPDGEYLGDIMEDKSVVDKNGRTVGYLMPDGLVIDDDGSLIGVEEAKKTDGSGMFVPAGTFGDGGAYGTGAGSPGNLGPGGGYGPGERYDPARQAALNAAMQQRRKNITVGKISNGVRKEAFDGMQKDWSEQGIGKVISSWRVNMSEMILSDKPIPAVIARAIDSNNPAPITAYVERNVYAEEGRNVIIPAGSRLIGTLGSVTASTEATSESARVQISWERLIRPDGSLFVFQGLTADAQGRAGALGYVDQQLFKKYTLPVLTTSLTSATSYFMSPNSRSSGDSESPRQQAANDARQNFINEMNNIFDEILRDKSNIKPMTYIPAGTRIIVFPNTDLWLRNWENDQDVTLQLEKPQILIDDAKSAAEGEKNKQDRLKTITATTSGDVVYDASMDDDVESAKAQTPLLTDTKSSKKSSSPTYVAPPPPPSVSGNTSARPSTSATSDSGSSNNSVPALF